MRSSTRPAFLAIVGLLAVSGVAFGQSDSEPSRWIPDTGANHELDERPASLPRDAGRIQPWSQNRRYWQYQGKPVLLIGGSDQDNLFNHPNLGPNGLDAHLDLLVSVGGNYVRNTMSSRDRADEGSDYFNDDSLYAFHRDAQTGLYDLERFNDAYWARFRHFLARTAERDIIVQIEIWDRWDYSGDREPHYRAYGWSAQPFNPKNNINYTAQQTGLSEERWQGHPIFRTIPDLDNVPQVLAYQKAFVDKLLSISLAYGHVLYCISNESDATEPWSRYWARFVRQRARRAGVGVEVTEMWNHWDLSHPMHRRTFEHPQLYSFVDVSQNNHQTGQTHWDNMQVARRLVADPPRPMNQPSSPYGLPRTTQHRTAANSFSRNGSWTCSPQFGKRGIGQGESRRGIGSAFCSLILNREALEPALIHTPLPSGSVMGMAAHGVGQGHPAEEVAHSPILGRLQYEVPVIRHKLIAQNNARVTLHPLRENPLERFIVFRFAKDLAPSVPAIQGMVAPTCFISALWSGDSAILTASPQQKKSPDTFSLRPSFSPIHTETWPFSPRPGTPGRGEPVCFAC